MELHLLKRLWDILKEAALEDQIITHEEANMLDRITDNLLEYALVLDRAWEDGIITEEERDFLKQAREQIWNEAYDEVLKDNIISTDEERLLHALLKVIHHLEEME
ncbi:MAG: hypothetical protein D6732_15460 [Methanobacteriota archaeon]|nr:MAG: hypothetical protein D6732_15460 [Euryarchaeota archaeon]